MFRILRENNPSLGLGKKVTLPPPLVYREGSKRTIFANINDQATRLHRPLDHFKDYLFAELGTNGSVDASHRLILKGRFQQKQLENVVRRYIHEYVTCKTCKSPDTLLAKENRVWFIACESCGSKRSVSAIKTGFQAQTTVSTCVHGGLIFRNERFCEIKLLVEMSCHLHSRIVHYISLNGICVEGPFCCDPVFQLVLPEGCLQRSRIIDH